MAACLRMAYATRSFTNGWTFKCLLSFSYLIEMSIQVNDVPSWAFPYLFCDISPHSGHRVSSFNPLVLWWDRCPECGDVKQKSKGKVILFHYYFNIPGWFLNSFYNIYICYPGILEIINKENYNPVLISFVTHDIMADYSY